MMPKTEKELEAFIMLQQLVDCKKNVDRGIWHFGSGAAYDTAKAGYELLKAEYLELVNEK